MGQAAVELPEPTDPLTAPPQASADDLLSKLAGDEIDRMLAEVESMAPTEPPAPTAKAAEAAAVLAVPAPPPSSPGLNADAEVQQQLDALFNELSAPPVAPGAAQDEVTSIVQDEKTTQAALTLPEAVTNPERHDQFESLTRPLSTEASPLSAGEESAGSGDSLDAQLVQSLGEAAEPTTAHAPPEQSRSGEEHDAVPSTTARGTPWYVKPLELLNAPFGSMKPEMRELLGKVAIVTAFNAVVIFVYVLVIRGR